MNNKNDRKRSTDSARCLSLARRWSANWCQRRHRNNAAVQNSHLCVLPTCGDECAMCSCRQQARWTRLIEQPTALGTKVMERLKNFTVDTGMVTIAVALSCQIALIVVSKATRRRREQKRGKKAWVDHFGYMVAPSRENVYTEPEIQMASFGSSYDRGESSTGNQAPDCASSVSSLTADSRDEQHRMYMFLQDSMAMAEALKAKIRARERLSQTPSALLWELATAFSMFMLVFVCVMWGWRNRIYLLHSEMNHHDTSTTL